MEQLQRVVDVVAQRYGRVAGAYERRKTYEWWVILVADGYDEIQAMHEAALLGLGITLESPFGPH